MLRPDAWRGIPPIWNGQLPWPALISGGMKRGARTPEELETLLEDAFVIRDPQALIELFENGAVLVAGDVPEARGEAIAGFASALWDGAHTYVADPRRILQARDTALVVADRGINVARRGRDGVWRYAIALLFLDHTTGTEDR
jgi:hypothetical protein